MAIKQYSEFKMAQAVQMGGKALAILDCVILNFIEIAKSINALTLLIWICFSHFSSIASLAAGRSETLSCGM
jgi:hypothetical protein